MQKVILGIGIPGSGKSTTIKSFLKKRNVLGDEKFVVVSPDEIRQRPEFRKDIYDPSDNKKVWSIARTELAKAIISGKSVIFDATFVTVRNRKEIIDFINDIKKARELDLKIQGVYFKTDLEIAKDRNQKRADKGPVPPDYLDNAFGILQAQEPTKAEGFDSIISVDNNDLRIGEELSFKNILR